MNVKAVGHMTSVLNHSAHKEADAKLISFLFWTTLEKFMILTLAIKCAESKA